MAKAFWILLTLLLGGCSLFSDRSEEYRQVVIGQTIQIPAGLASEQISPVYPIPEIDNQRPLPVTYELPQPPDGTAAIIVSPYRLESANGETWLQLFDSPSEVWPLLDLYWQEYALGLVRKDTSLGFMATMSLSDASIRNSSLMDVLEKSPERPLVVEGMSFQIKIINGVRRNTSEVQVRALLPNQDSAGQEGLSESINARLERAMLEHIGAFVTSEAIASRHSFRANEIGGGSRVRLLDDTEQGQFLELKLGLERAKTELEQALDAAGVIVAQYDLDNNQVYVSYLNEDDLESWYHTSSMIDARREEKNIRLKIVQEESGLVIVRASRENEEIEQDMPNQLLTIIFEHIS